MSAQADKEVIETSEWLTDYDTALKKAAKQDKNILVFFTGSDWCPPCKMLKIDLFENNEFKALSDNYILLYVDIPRNKDILTAKQLQHNRELNSKYNKKGAVPLLKVLNENGKELGKYSGYSMNGEIKYHLNLLRKHQ